MKQIEIIELAMEALILRKMEPEADEIEIERKLKELSVLFAEEARRKQKKDR